MSKKQKIRDQIYSDACDWLTKFGEPYKLKFISQRYTSRLKLLGYDRPHEFVIEDPRLEVQFTKNAGVLVAPKEMLNLVIQLEYEGKPHRFWSKFNVVV